MAVAYSNLTHSHSHSRTYIHTLARMHARTLTLATPCVGFRYNWMVGNEEAPEYLLESQLMARLIEFAKNKRKELRIELPPLRTNNP